MWLTNGYFSAEQKTPLSFIITVQVGFSFCTLILLVGWKEEHGVIKTCATYPTGSFLKQTKEENRRGVS